MASFVDTDTLLEVITRTTKAVKDYADSNFQKMSDDSLLTEDKTIVGAINELSQKAVDITEINLIDGGNASGTEI